ncbi:MAG TPA: argininosuccinate synthase, partial [Myxococcota bacterium]|nr:argininosuccinate synthase [Myxococcota bacterium]
MHIVLAFSGGLDTSYLLRRFVAEGHRVTAITVDTGGFPEEERTLIAARAAELGADSYQLVDARERVYRQHLSYLIKGNIRRGGVY